MKTSSEYNFFATELEPLGIRRENLHRSNDIYEIENLIDDIKQAYIQDYCVVHPWMAGVVTVK